MVYEGRLTSHDGNENFMVPCSFVMLAVIAASQIRNADEKQPAQWNIFPSASSGVLQLSVPCSLVTTVVIPITEMSYPSS
jgi:hypothetical protein